MRLLQRQGRDTKHHPMQGSGQWAFHLAVLQVANSGLVEQGQVTCTRWLPYSFHSMRLNLSAGRCRGLHFWRWQALGGALDIWGTSECL